MTITIFRFICSQCHKEILTDSVVAKCCNGLMEQKETYHLKDEEVKSLFNGNNMFEQLNNKPLT